MTYFMLYVIGWLAFVLYRLNYNQEGYDEIVREFGANQTAIVMLAISFAIWPIALVMGFRR